MDKKAKGGFHKLTTKVRMTRDIVLKTTIFLPSVKRDVEKIPSKTIVTPDGCYSADMIQEWVYPEAFKTARQWCVYDTLINYLRKMHICVVATSGLDAFNILKEATYHLAGAGFLNCYFSKWLSSCYDEFNKHYEDILVGSDGNRPA